MKYILIAPVLLVLAFHCFSWVEGLDCYICNHIDGYDGPLPPDMTVHKSCKNGKKPDKDFAVSCDTSYDSCGKLYYEGKTSLTGSEEIKFTMRGCIPTVPYVDGKCEELTAQNISGLPDLPVDLRLILSAVPPQAKATVCSCKDDECNSGSILQITQGFLLVVFASIFLHMHM